MLHWKTFEETIQVNSWMAAKGSLNLKRQRISTVFFDNNQYWITVIQSFDCNKYWIIVCFLKSEQEDWTEQAFCIWSISINMQLEHFWKNNTNTFMKLKTVCNAIWACKQRWISSLFQSFRSVSWFHAIH